MRYILSLLVFAAISAVADSQNWRISQTAPTGSGTPETSRLFPQTRPSRCRFHTQERTKAGRRKGRSQTFDIFFYSHRFIELQPIRTFRAPRP